MSVFAIWVKWWLLDINLFKKTSNFKTFIFANPKKILLGLKTLWQNFLRNKKPASTMNKYNILPNTYMHIRLNYQFNYDDIKYMYQLDKKNNFVQITEATAISRCFMKSNEPWMNSSHKQNTVLYCKSKFCSKRYTKIIKTGKNCMYEKLSRKSINFFFFLTHLLWV